MWYFAIVCIIYIVRWAINGKLPWQYDLLKNIRIIKLPTDDYEVHVRNTPFGGLNKQFNSPLLKWFRWYKFKYTKPSSGAKSHMDLHIITSPFAIYKTEHEAKVAVTMLKSRCAKPVIDKPTIVGYF